MTSEQADTFVGGKSTEAVLAAITADQAMTKDDIVAVLRAVERRFVRKSEKRAAKVST